jgi:hypothetical protein
MFGLRACAASHRRLFNGSQELRGSLLGANLIFPVPLARRLFDRLPQV